MRARALCAEWVKFRTVRGWVIAMIAAALAIIALGLGPGNGHGSCNGASCQGPTGPGGEMVTDSFYFVRQPLAGNGSITVRATSLTGEIPSYTSAGGRAGRHAAVMPWAKAGIIVKAGTAQGSAYAAMMVTGSHGVRMQYNYTGDIAGLPGSVSAESPRWLRLTRSGDTITGYDSADGTAWRRVGTVRLAGLPATAQAGLFATSPQYAQTAGLFQNSVSGGLTQATGTFDHVGLTGTGAWTGTDIGAPQGPAPGPATGFRQAGGGFSVTGSGDITPAVSGPAGIGTTLAQALIGTFAGLIVIVVVGAMFTTAEYRCGLIRVTLAATPRRGRVLAAKAAVMGAVTFAVVLAASAVTVILGQRELRADGVYVWPASGLTQARVIVGTAAVLAVAAVIAVALGAVLRRSAAAVATVIVVLVLPYLLTVAAPILPPASADWLDRVAPAAAFAVQQTAIAYPQVDNLYAPAQGYYPLAPWAGFAVLCGWAAVALGVATYLLRRRDA
jgi:ABC-type transport system involved in multi-copper enzyme maturation permease subunit